LGPGLFGDDLDLSVVAAFTLKDLIPLRGALCPKRLKA
jgi:hypothetical protein